MIPDKIQKEQSRSRIIQIIRRLDNHGYTNKQVSEIIGLDTSKVSCLRHEKNYQNSVWLKKMQIVIQKWEKFLNKIES